MLEESALELRIHPPYLAEDLAEQAAFLKARGLEALAQSPDYTVTFAQGGRLVGSGSLVGGVIQGLGVDESLRGSGLAARIVSELEAEAFRRGLSTLLVFTGPANQAIFTSLGYRTLAEARLRGQTLALLLEKGGGLESWLEGLEPQVARAKDDAPASRPGPLAALVMNCNPFTLGHRHLVERAAAESRLVLLFVVKEEASSFPYDVRLRLVREGVADLPGVLVIPGSDYLVSRATFPTYFLKDRAGEAAAIHARLDADLFGRHIAPALGVGRRYLGQEPYSPVTALYNEALAEVLPPLGVEVVEIPRLELEGRAISASEVRRAIREGRLESARPLVPASTWKYLVSPEAKPVLQRVAQAEGRH